MVTRFHLRSAWFKSDGQFFQVFLIGPVVSAIFFTLLATLKYFSYRPQDLLSNTVIPCCLSTWWQTSLAIAGKQCKDCLPISSLAFEVFLFEIPDFDVRSTLAIAAWSADESSIEAAHYRKTTAKLMLKIQAFDAVDRQEFGFLTSILQYFYSSVRPQTFVRFI